MTKHLIEDKKQQTALKIFGDLKKWIQVSSLSYLKLGFLLKKIRDEKLYELLGEGSPEYENFGNFLKMPEIDIPLRKAYYFMEIWTKFVEQLKFSPEELSEISWTRLRELIPIIRQENKEDLISDAKTLSHSDLTVKIKQLKSGWNADDICDHKEVACITFYSCLNCQENFKSLPPKSKIVENK